MAAAKHAVREARVRKKETPRSSLVRCLIICADPSQAELCSELLREVADCQIDVISRIESNFEWIGRSSYHFVVMDGVPQPLELLERVKRLSPVTGVIIVSDRATVEEAVATVRLGAEDYLKKPFSVESFQLAVKRALDRKAVLGDDTGAANYLHLLNACQMISATLERPHIFAIVQSYLARALQSDHSAIYALSGGGPVRVEDFGDGANRDRAMEEILDIAVYAAGILPGLSASGETARFVERGQLTPGLFVFRFRCGGGTEYFCVCLSPRKPPSVEAFESQLRMLRAQIEASGKNIEQFLGVQNLAFVDDATGLYNTRYLNTILDREIAQSRESSRPFAVLFIDADRFKQVNDSHGHLVGTRLLNELGNHLKRFVRESDTVFRYGGDEFVAVLSGCDLATARAVAERIRQSVQEASFLVSEGLDVQFTVSIGVALFPDHAASKRAIIEAADRAMYAAKKGARNSVFIADAVADGGAVGA